MTLIYPVSLGRTGMIGRPTSFPILPVGGAAFVGALDGIANLVHLYCIARRWLSAYEGRLARLRRTSDSVEADFTYDSAGNLDVAAIAAWAGGSSFIVVVADQVSGDDVSQGTAGSQPEFVASGQNGHAVSRRTDLAIGEDRLRVTFASALSQPYTIYAVAKLATAAIGETTRNRFIFDGVVLSPSARSALFRQSPVQNFAAFAGAVLNDGAENDDWNIWSVLFNGLSSQLWANGSSVATGNAGTQNMTGIVIGTAVNNANPWTGDIGTVAVADPNNDTTDRQAVEAALEDYWDIIP